MLVSLIPLFNEDQTVRAYSLFTQKKNYFLTPSLLGTGQNDGAARVEGMEILESMGLETISADKEIFVPVNNISIFVDIEEQYRKFSKRIVLLIDHLVPPEEMYVSRIRQLKDKGFKLAVAKLEISEFEPFKEILLMTDYILLDHKKINIDKAKIYFKMVYPNVKLCAVNIDDMETFEKLKEDGGYEFYEGKFFRMPVTKGQNQVSPLKVNYIQLLNMVNSTDFELTKAADVIGRDTALVISLLKMVNRMSRNSQITSIRHAAAMLGERELKKWLTTAVANQLYADKPNEITRLSLLRAKFAENLAATFSLASMNSELFLMGLFSVLDVILETPMEEALKIVKVSDSIRKALVEHKGPFAQLLDFVLQYEGANWQEVTRQMVLYEIDMNSVYSAYIQALEWYRDMIMEER